MSSDNSPFLWNPSPLTIVGVLVLCVLGVALLHFMTRRVYLRVVRDQAMAAQPAPSVQLQPLPRWPPDLEAPPTPVQPTAAPRLAVLVLQPDSKIVYAVEDCRQGPAANNGGSRKDGVAKAPLAAV
ncbi:hypothetical protein COCSUDRAFT_68250 [Coccomyxa subellipsoidea C-169]|uniref:Uncharacterized protein n=1 Tax=Coccomyxa subellipsoidea (strain C-169) TaxID=574566 RepID=I0YJG2_COCSC|nr:hypothetical protein COCSUDRAFT_68250 [Coccomyxa subellipsoidea C-169]EIE18531.1 hypothetical protein COCSUDRAFT_68250 [Coccomyxa subellipsoidea C-169]|eukprot:XP_005643075.1 hypothetical protein COCSUDRAFT_68250 [Coccomyxa subellipsoidea C-169]